jgi:uncharacterized membrane protein
MIPWNALHPVVVHFPIALLIVAPLFALIGLLKTRNARAYAVCALILMALGTIGAWFAVETGEAAKDTLILSAAQSQLVREHAEAGEATRNVFTILSIIYAGVLFGPALLKRPLRNRSQVVLGVVFLIIYAVSLLLVVKTGDLGGRLVHRSGQHVHIDDRTMR